jgi:hypothetical protein
MPVETDITKRWESGTPHHPRSKALYKKIAKLDFELCSDSFGFKAGGDGDNGENLMYLLDIIFEQEDEECHLLQPKPESNSPVKRNVTAVKNKRRK